MTTRWTYEHITQWIARYALPLGLAAVFLHLAWRNIGLFPVVLADEWHYSNAARLQSLDQSILPSYLFLGLYRITSACGPGFLDCARLLNAVLLVAAAPFVYLIARLVCGRVSATVLALAAVLAPISSFAAYFMPETMYYLAFCVFSWLALARTAATPLSYGLATGAALGVMSAIKVHALVLLPAHLAFILYLCLAQYRHDGWLRRALMMAAMAILAMLALRMAIGYGLAGSAGMNLLGSFYGPHASNSASSLDALLRVLPAAVVNLKGHLLALGLLMALPLATLVLHLVDTRTRAQASPQQRALQVFGLLMLCAAGALTVMFTASIAATGPLEGMRLHLRYYDFTFALLLLIAAAPLARPAAPQSLLKRAVVALPVGAIVLYAARVLPAEYGTGLVDSPELAVLREFPAMLTLHVGMALLTLAAWVLNRRAGILLFVFFALPVTTLQVNEGVREIQARSRFPNAYDKAGLLTRHYLDREQAGRLTIAGHGLGDLSRTLFQVDHPGALMHDMSPGAPLTHEELVPGRDWMLVVGGHRLPDGIEPEIRNADFALLKVKRDHTPLARLEFTRLDTSLLAKAEGLSYPEHWGRWSSGPLVRLHFARPLPQKLNILLRASTLPAKTGQQFVLVVGGQRKPFRLAGIDQDRFFQFETDGSQQAVSIEISEPTAPQAIGYGPDDRLLGIALVSMEIGTR